MTIDITNPGVVEIANQGYPRAPDGGSPAPTNDNVRVADQATPPAPLDSVFSTNPPPPLQPTLPANQGNPLGLPTNLTVPAENPVLAGVVNDVCSLKLFLDGCTFAALTAGNITITIILDSGTRFTFTQTLSNLQVLGGTDQATLLFTPTPGNFILGAIMTVIALQGPGLQVPTTTGSVQRDTLSSQDGEIVPISSIATSQTITTRLSDTLTTDLMEDDTPPANPKAYLVSQVGSIQIDAAEAIVDYTIGVLSALCNVKMTLSGCTFDLLTAGNLVITIFFSDGTNTVTTIALGDLQALGAVATGQIPFAPTPGKIIIGARMVVTALQGPGLLIPGTVATVQRVGSPDGELIDVTQIAVSQTVVGGTSGVVSNVAVVTDDATGLPPTVNTVNLRLTFAMTRSFTANGISLVGRPVTFQEIDVNRPILIMADFYLVVANNDPNDGAVVPLGIEPGALISFDVARYAGELIFQVDPFATQNVGAGTPIELPGTQPQVGIYAETMTAKIDLVGCNFNALTNGNLAVSLTLANGTFHYTSFNHAALVALGNRASALISLPFAQGDPPPFVAPNDIVLTAYVMIGVGVTGPGLVAATIVVQRVGRPMGEIIPTCSILTMNIFTHRFNTPGTQPGVTIGGASRDVNVADQISTIGTPLNVLP